MKESDAYDLIVKLEKKMAKSQEKFREDILRIRASVKLCKHRHTEPFEWEHDDGYGRQSRREGRRCLVCLKVNQWPGISNYWSVE